MTSSSTFRSARKPRHRPPKRPADALREALSATPQRPFAYTQIMTDDSHHPADAEDRSDDHQQAVEACQHATDALANGDFPYS
jgi:hypothetical protein